MSSSLLIILLVVVWLFVLAPMLIRSRNPIRRTGDALAQTRTLYSGGSGRLVPSRGRAAVDPVRVEADDSLFGLPSGVGATDAELLDTDTWEHLLEQTLRRESAGKRGEAVRRAMAERRIPAPGSDPAATEPAPEGLAPADPSSRDLTADEHDTAERTTEIPAVVVATGAGPVETGQSGDSRRPEVVDGELVEHTERSSGQDDHAEDAAGIDAEAVHVHRGRRRPVEPEVELTDADLDFAERRRGRGAYDPMADREAAEQRAHARQRTALILVALAVVAVIAALLTVPAVWWFAGGAGLLLASYLTYLRRQVRIEDSLRRRRVERMRRARLGVESREDDELSVVPPRLRRPGAVVLEVDDEDPAFDTLDTVDRDRGTDPGHYDHRTGRHDHRAGHQERRTPHREPLRRAVG